MILTKDELVSSLKNEIRILVHLASKADPATADYRPSPGQRSLLELLRYLTIMAPIHLRGVMAPAFSMDAWSEAWNAGEAAAKTLTLPECIDAIGRQSALVDELLGAAAEADLRTEIEMFGRRGSRASMVISLVLCHFSAYRMQLFLYLKASGREELNTMNLWVGIDRAM